MSISKFITCIFYTYMLSGKQIFVHEASVQLPKPYCDCGFQNFTGAATLKCIKIAALSVCFNIKRSIMQLIYNLIYSFHCLES